MSFIMKGKFIYLAHPRTASVATEAALLFTCPEGTQTTQHHRMLHEIECGEERTGNEYLFTTIRDPLDVLASWWTLNTQWHDKLFLDFLNHFHHIYLTIDDKLFFHLPATRGKYIRYEHLQEDFNIAMIFLGYSPKLIPKLNISKNKIKDYKSLYGTKEIKVMWKRFPVAMEIYYGS